MPTEMDIPIACSLRSDALEQRLAWIRRVTSKALLSHQLDGASLRLRYRPEALPDLEQIVANERQCCSFSDFALEALPTEVRLTLHAPKGLESDARWLFDQFLPPTDAAPRKGCGCAPGACG